MPVKRVFSHAPWEEKVGYCRALRAGNQVFVTGTAPIADDGSTYAPGDAFAQAARCFELIEQALINCGARMSDVVRTRMFVTDINRWEEFGRAHKAVFKNFPPATTMVEVQALIAPEMLIEVEADAYISED